MNHHLYHLNILLFHVGAAIVLECMGPRCLGCSQVAYIFGSMKEVLGMATGDLLDDIPKHKQEKALKVS